MSEEKYILRNQAKGELSASASDESTTLVLGSISNTLADALSEVDSEATPAKVVPLVLEDGEHWEIVRVTAWDGDSEATVDRGAFGSTAREWESGTAVELRAVDAVYNNMLTHSDKGTEVGNVVPVVDVNGTPGLPELDGSNLTGIGDEDDDGVPEETKKLMAVMAAQGRFSFTPSVIFPEGTIGATFTNFRDIAANHGFRVATVTLLNEDEEQDPAIYRSEDYGLTWERVDDETAAIGLATLDNTFNRNDDEKEGIWLAAGFEGALAKSEDNGKSWEALSHGLPEEPEEEWSFTIVRYGGGKWVVGADHPEVKGLHSSDDGDTWEQVSGFDQLEGLVHPVYLGEDYGWMGVGAELNMEGEIEKWKVFKSSDGENWEHERDVDDAEPSQHAFGWAAGEEGTFIVGFRTDAYDWFLLIKRDGEDWKEVHATYDGQDLDGVNGIACLDDQTFSETEYTGFWVIGTDSGLWFSEDDGETWFVYDLPRFATRPNTSPIAAASGVVCYQADNLLGGGVVSVVGKPVKQVMEELGL